MTPDQWKQVKRLLESALIVSPGERLSFVQAQAGGDQELCREVLSLLESHEDAGEFLESPVLDVHAVSDPPETTADFAGIRVGAYELIREIGRGGMGTVYLAARADQEFRKRVAIKLIRAGMENELAVRRFRHERQILARLEHPNIARLIDGGATSEGHPYFVMEYVEGEPLISHCVARSLPIHERVEIFRNVCSAVHYAHRRMIVHRDLKPGNILVKQDGAPKLLDFGIAKILDPDATDRGWEATRTGFRLLTPAYSSPEQMRGEPASIRSDIFSLGIILWELITDRPSWKEGGKRSFDLPLGGQDDTARLLLRNLRNVVLKAVPERPDERYQSVEAFSADLQRALAGADILFNPEQTTAGPLEAPPQGSIAVLPFQLLGADTTSETYLGAGIADAIITRLSNVGRIAVRPTGAVMKFSAGADALDAGRDLNVQFVLEGRVQTTRGRVRVTVQLVEMQTRAPIWAGSFDEQFDDLLKLEDSISGQVAQALVPQLTGEERRELARPGTTSAKAHQAYLRGRWYWSKHTEDALPQALILFTEAVAEDPGYGRAHAGIADYHIALGIRGLLPPVESFAAAIQSARAAIELDPRLAEAHASLGFAIWVQERDYETAAHHLQLAIALNPDYVPAHDLFGLVNSARGKPEIAIASIECGSKLDPDSAVCVADLAMCYYNARQYDRAIAVFWGRGQPMPNEVPESPPVVNGAVLTLSLLAKADNSGAMRAAIRFADVTGRSALARAVLARAEAAAGNPDRARKLLDELEGEAGERYISGVALALANLACGRKEEAVARLEHAWRDRDWWTMYLGLMPVWDELRGRPRFDRLVNSRGNPAQPAALSAAASRSSQAAVRTAKTWTWALLAAGVVLAIALALPYVGFRATPPPFQNARISKLTTNGIAERAAISPDGRYVAYTTRNQGQAMLWVRSLRDGRTYGIAGPFDGLIPSLQFTRNGAHVAFVRMPVNESHGGVLYIAPVTGGDATVVMSGVSLPVGVSPDESHFAYYRTDPVSGAGQLVVSDANRADSKVAHEQVLNSRTRPEAFVQFPGPVWSPDGKRIVCAVRGPLRAGYGIQLSVIDLHGSIQALDTPPWQNITEVAWIADPGGLVIAGQDTDSPFQQLWYASLGRRGIVRITNDLNNYQSVAVTADGSAMVSVQMQIVTNLYVLRTSDPAHPAQITPGGGRYFDVAWAPNGNLVYASDATGLAEIWAMDANGNGQRQLTAGLGRNYAPAVSPDGKTVAFHSNRGGVWNIWKMDFDGGNPSQVTHDSSDSTYPQFTPDGGSVVYQHVGADALQSIWKTPLAGGAPIQLTGKLSMYPTISADGRMASWYCENPKDPSWAIAIYEWGSATPARLFGFPINRMPQVLLRWAPEMNAVDYIENLKGVSNIWTQPLNGAPAKQLTSFPSGIVYSFDWSRDGRLVYSRGISTSDVLLMRNPKKQ